jgi:hypothetical protein
VERDSLYRTVREDFSLVEAGAAAVGEFGSAAPAVHAA